MTELPSAPRIPGLTHIRRLGSGGYADVHLYEQDMPARGVAVKVMKGASHREAEAQRFVAEANAMALLEHPHIVPVYSTGTTDDGRPYLVMMYYPRASLAERVRTERFSVAEVLRIGIQISAAVETAHRAGLLHRDIKPANILTSQYGAPGLTDFGIASHVSDDSDDDAGVSVPWAPVETLYATGPATVRSDVYSLAATLWHLLVGRSPFEVVDGDNSTYALMRRIRDVPAPSPGRPDVPASLDRLLRAALAKEPGVRPASALAFARALQSVEMELRLTPTEIVLATEMTTSRAADALPGRQETRLKPQQAIIAATEPHVMATVGSSHAGSSPSRTAPRPAAGAAGQTHRRALPEGDETTPRSVLARARRGSMIVAGALAAAGVVIVGLQVANATRVEPTEPGASPAVLAPAVDSRVPAPGAARVTASREGDAVTFTWTYDHALPDDGYLISVDGSSPQSVAQARFVTTSVSTACARVRVMRADGSGYQAEYSAEACA